MGKVRGSHEQDREPETKGWRPGQVGGLQITGLAKELEPPHLDT